MRRHELDPVSLVFGFAFTSAGLLFLAGRLDQAVRLRWLWPLLLLALGLGVLLDLNARRPKAPTEPADAAEAEAPEAKPVTAEQPDAEPVAAEAAEVEQAEAERLEAEPVVPEEAARTAELEPEGPPPERDR
jgi:hypothetical protein